MIYSVTFHSNSYINEQKRSQLDTHLIRLSNSPIGEMEEHSYLSINNFVFLDDLYPTVHSETMTIAQAVKLKKTLKKIEDTPDLCEVLITCDTGKTASAALAQYISETFPRARFHQKCSSQYLNKAILITMRLADCKAIKPSLIEVIDEAMTLYFDRLKALSWRIKARGFRENTQALIDFFRSEF